MDQDAVIAFLSDPATHGGEVPARIETHGAMIFLLPSRVYKMKRAVRYPFMDFSTVEKRREACRGEVVLNRRTAPDLYRGTLPILKGAGGLTFGALNADAPDAVETVVVMERFDDTLADAPASNAELTELAEEVAGFHEAEPPLSVTEEAATVWEVQNGNLSFLESNPTVDPTLIGTLRERSRAVWEKVAPGLDARAEQGHVRHCHGDLHLANVCRWKGRVVPFDCIEFNPAFSETDTLYDLAFLLMDLDEQDRRDGANLVLNRYLEIRPGDVPALDLLPLFLSMRAQIRGKVAFATIPHLSDPAAAAAKQEEAHHFLRRAIGFLSPKPPMLVAVGGPSGSGKSTLARALAPFLGAAPGAVIARSDAIRKRLYGNGVLTDPLPPSAFVSAASRATYGEMEAICRAALSAGQAAIADATFTHAGSRKRIEALAADLNIPFLGFWLDLDQETARQRVTARTGDASDATADVVDLQFNEGWGQVDWVTLDAKTPLSQQIETALTALPG